MRHFQTSLRTEAEQGGATPPRVQITCVSISKRITTTGTPSNQRMTGISPSNVSQAGSIACQNNVAPAVKFRSEARDGTRYSSARRRPELRALLMPRWQDQNFSNERSEPRLRGLIPGAYRWRRSLVTARINQFWLGRAKASALRLCVTLFFTRPNKEY
jgi:hypothetical protein